MKHFDITDGADFARGVTAGADRAVMEAHVSSGCRRCRATLGLMQRVVASTRADGRSDSPEPVVRCPKAIIALLSPQGSLVSSLIPRLPYGSFRDPAPPAIRPHDRLPRPTLYANGHFL